MVIKRLIFCFLFVLLLSTAAFAGPEATPTQRVKQGVDTLITILSDPKMQDPAGHEEAVAELRAAAEKFIDFRLVTMYSVGRPWLDMSPKMQDDLTEAFIKLLERSYLKKIPAYGGQDVEYTKELVQGTKAKVFTELVDKDKKIVVEFRLKTVDNQWVIYDVVAEGVSLVSNYRSQFSQVLADGTPEDLLKIIRERIEKIDAGQDEPEAQPGTQAESGAQSGAQGEQE
jgi:ABC-type transport system involved in resistance to organic solvents, auxiliary component